MDWRKLLASKGALALALLVIIAGGGLVWRHALPDPVPPEPVKAQIIVSPDEKLYYAGEMLTSPWWYNQTGKAVDYLISWQDEFLKRPSKPWVPSRAYDFLVALD